MDLQVANNLLSKVDELVKGVNRTSSKLKSDQVKVGLDLGTSSIVLVVVDYNNNPLFATSRDADVVRDGLVVDYVGAVRISRELKNEAEEVLGLVLVRASGAIPPGTVGKNKEIIRHIIEGIGMECVSIIDEPTAAAAVLGIDEGGVLDVGGGTTGISILEEGKVVFSADQATGGSQMTLVLAGYHHISVLEAECLKRDKRKQKEVFPIIKPVVEKMATITASFLTEFGRVVPVIYLVGGATNFKECSALFEKVTETKIVQPAYPQYVTPLGIAMSME